jgi:thymidylate synthase ThyX
MAYSAKILADSITTHGEGNRERLTTFEVTFPRIVLAEVNTHRMISKCSASSRAIPVAKKIAQIEEDPFVPSSFVKNQKGMQGAVALADDALLEAESWWDWAKTSALASAKHLADAGVHKALANRVLEPFAWHTAILTATDWANFFHLRVNPDAQGEFRTAAEMMLALYDASVPRPLNEREWHLPLVSTEERIEDDRAERPIERLVKISVARCARVSYLTHDGIRDQNEDLALYDKLLAAGHMSPLEHAARPMTSYERTRFDQIPHAWDGRAWVWQGDWTTHYLGNFNGWVQHRKLIRGEADILGYRKGA